MFLYCYFVPNYLYLLSSISDSDTKRFILYNLAWFSFINKDFNYALDNLKQIENDGLLSENGIFIKCFYLYQLDQLKEADTLYLNIILTFTDPMYKLEMKILHSEYSQNDGDIEKKLIQLNSITKDSRNFENYEFVLDRLITYYENRNKYKYAIVYYKEKITLMNWIYSN